jgi:GT2 family glycosyltransferase
MDESGKPPGLTRAMSESVLAIIPFYRRADQLNLCRRALGAQDVAVATFVHDNSTTNLGFSRACNLGLQEAVRRQYPFALLLNQDCYLCPTAVRKLLEHMDKVPRCAIAGAKQIWAGDKDRILHGGCRGAFPRGEHIEGKLSLGDCATSAPMPWVNGACMMARTAAFVQFGLLDERMFLVGSDSDWCYRARAAGWEVWYCAEAECYHEAGVTALEPDPETRRVLETDMARWCDKWVANGEYRRFESLTENVRT